MQRRDLRDGKVYLNVPVKDSWRDRMPLKLRAEAAYVLNLIHKKWCNYKSSSDGWVNIKIEYLRKYVRKSSVAEVLEILCEENVIEIDRRYQEGVHSRSYRLMPDSWQSRTWECDDEVLKSKILSTVEFPLVEVHRELRKRLGWLSFDESRAEQIWLQMAPAVGEENWWNIERARRKENIRRVVREINNGICTLSRDRYGRVHTAVTNLASELRCCLTYNNEQLIGLDLSNSQPLFAGITAARYLGSSCASQKRLERWQPPKGRDPYGRRRQLQCSSQFSLSGDPTIPASGFPAPTATCLPTRGTAGPATKDSFTMSEVALEPEITVSNRGLLSLPEDVQRYISVCEHGRLYDDLVDAQMSREQVKKALFRDVFFGKDHFPSELRRRFSKRYPTVSEVVRRLKSEDYRRMAWLMQNEESRCFIGRIAKQLMQDFPQMPIVTIHDSILTTEEYVDVARNEILSALGELGVSPQLHRDEY